MMSLLTRLMLWRVASWFFAALTGSGALWALSYLASIPDNPGVGLLNGASTLGNLFLMHIHLGRAREYRLHYWSAKFRESPR